MAGCCEGGDELLGFIICGKFLGGFWVQQCSKNGSVHGGGYLVCLFVCYSTEAVHLGQVQTFSKCKPQ